MRTKLKSKGGKVVDPETEVSQEEVVRRAGVVQDKIDSLTEQIDDLTTRRAELQELKDDLSALIPQARTKPEIGAP